MDSGLRMLKMLVLWHCSKVWFDAVKHLVFQSPYGEDPLEVLWRTLIADMKNVPGEPQIDSSCFRSFMAMNAIDIVKHMAELSNGETIVHPADIGGLFPDSESKPSRAWRESLQATQTRIRTSLYPTAEDIEVFDTLYKKSSLFLATVSTYMTNRQLCVTSTGLVGLGPASIKEGDEVICVKDSKLLFVARPGDGEQELVGETYLHGRMGTVAAIAKYGMYGLRPPWGDIVLR